MLILALDSTAVVATVALCRDETPIASFTVKNGNTHSETLLPMVEAVLKAANVTVADVDLFACSVGPGSFTGVRIGTATIKGLAFGQNKPCIGVSTLEAMARSLGLWQGVICCVMDARRNQVYNALFRAERGNLSRLTEDRAISLDALGDELKKLEETVFLVGDGSNLCYNTIRACCDMALPQEHRLHQRASGVALAAQAMIDRGEPGDAEALTPNYLRLSQAERERLSREQQR